MCLLCSFIILCVSDVLVDKKFDLGFEQGLHFYVRTSQMRRMSDSFMSSLSGADPGIQESPEGIMEEFIEAEDRI